MLNTILNLLAADEAALASTVKLTVVVPVKPTVAAKVIMYLGGTATQSISLPVGMARGHYKVEIIAPDKSTETISLMLNR